MVVLNCRVGILYIIESSCQKKSIPGDLMSFLFWILTHSSIPWRLISPVWSRISDRAVRETRQPRSGVGYQTELSRRLVSPGLESDIRQTLQVSCHWPSSSDTSVSSEVNNVLFSCTASTER